ncbi:MAG: hypothetical protein R2800_10950 [Flavipsychrobacter sp.]
MTTYLEQNWRQLTVGLETEKTISYYKQLIDLYNNPSRHYHNLSHIYTLLKYTDQYAHLLSDSKTIKYAIWYHDAIYDSSKNDNEEKSAALALEHMTNLGIEKQMIDTCCKMIIATKTHKLTNDIDSFDAQFLLDIDLSILGTKEEEYRQYTKHIRQEYIIYPDPMYTIGRKNVIEHFLAMDRIYKTDLFFGLCEEHAKENLKEELKQLLN